MDEFVSSHGFEFIDGDNDSRSRALDSDDDSTGEFPLVRTPFLILMILYATSFTVFSHTRVSPRRRRAKHDHVANHDQIFPQVGVETQKQS